MEKYYIGIDGGGTKTEFLLADGCGNILGQEIKEGSNPNDKGLEAAYKVLSDGLKELLTGADIDPKNIYIFVGISGAGIGDNAKFLQDKLQSEYPNIKVESDLANALEICLGDEDGLAVICGTGISSVIRAGAKTRVIGGYGYLFEDGGSGYAYGRDAIKAAIRYEDGIGEETILYEYLTNELGKGLRSSLGEILKLGKAFVASFCPLVFQGYQNEDEICKKIIQENLRYTVALIEDALKAYPTAKPTIAFIGGVSKQAVFRESIKKNFNDYELIFCEEKPVVGALRRAIKGETKC